MIPTTGYRLNFEAQSEAALPEWTGSVWRGAFGHAFRKQQCKTNQAECTNCEAVSGCLYASVFETPVPDGAERMRKYTNAPHPYLLRPSGKSNDQQQLDLLLIGRHRVNARAIINAIIQGAHDGLGRRKTPYRLTRVTDISDTLGSKLRTLSTGHVTVKLQTTCRINKQGRPMTPHTFDHKSWLKSLLRRFASLAYFHHPESALDEAQIQAMLNAIDKTEIFATKLRWHKLERRSSRQHKLISLGGLLGEFSLSLNEDKNRIIKLLETGTVIHNGKSAVMGLGQYTIDAGEPIEP